MTRSVFRFFGLALVTAVTSCATVPAEQQVREEVGPRAAFDLNCPKEQLRFQCLDSGCYTAGVTGCGRKCTYVYVRQPGQMGGQWVLNGDGSR